MCLISGGTAFDARGSIIEKALQRRTTMFDGAKYNRVHLIWVDSVDCYHRVVYGRPTSGAVPLRLRSRHDILYSAFCWCTHRLRMACVNEKSSSYTCHSHAYPQTVWTITIRVGG